MIQIMSVEKLTTQPDDAAASGSNPPALPEWCRVYDGLSDVEIEALEAVVLTRADLTRAS